MPPNFKSVIGRTQTKVIELVSLARHIIKGANHNERNDRKLPQRPRKYVLWTNQLQAAASVYIFITERLFSEFGRSLL